MGKFTGLSSTITGLEKRIEELEAENQFIRATIENEITAHIEELMAENKQLREALEASHNGTICPLCHSLPHSSTCPGIVALEGGDE